MTVELLYLPNCPHHSCALDLVRDVLKDEAITAELTETLISNYEQARQSGFPGSPTIRVNGRDIEGVPSGCLAVGFACRTYQGGRKTTRCAATTLAGACGSSGMHFRRKALMKGIRAAAFITSTAAMLKASRKRESGLQ